MINFRKFALLICLTLVGATCCQADTIELVVDQSQSVVAFEVLGTTEFSSVAGTGTIEINPGSEPFSTAQITELELNVADGFEFNLLFGAVTISTDPGDVMVLLSSPGPAGAVDARNQFDQLGNFVALAGTVSVDDPLGLAGGSMTVALADTGLTLVDLVGGQLSVAGDTLTVQIPISISIDVNPAVPVTANASVVLTGELMPFVLGDVNCDGVVNLLDVIPFIDAVANDVFNPKADINQDNAVNLLDVDGFVQLIAGG